MNARMLLLKALLGSLCLIMLLAVSPATAQVNAPQLWKARALEAAERFKTLKSKLNTLQDRWDSDEANETKCEAMLESAFALHIAQESSVHKVAKNGEHSFKIILSGGDQGYFDLTYLYDATTWNITTASVLSLPRAWELFLPAGAIKNTAVIVLVLKEKEDGSPLCILGFSLDDPFLAHVSRSEGKGKAQKLR